MKKHIALFLISVLLTPVAWAEIYQRENPDGSIIFTDQPLIGGKPVKLKDPSIISEKELPAVKPEAEKKPAAVNNKPEEKDKKKEPEKPAVVGYKSFTLNSPKNEQTFHNQRNISVSFSINPELQEGDKIQLKVDGSNFGKPATSTSMSVNNLDRGSHTLQAEVISKNGRTMITSNKVTIFVHYAAIGGG